MGHNRNLADYAHHFDGTHIDLGSGNIETQGVLTYEDVTNVDAIGIVTARAGVKVPDNQKVFLGTGDDLQIYHDGNHSRIVDSGTGNLVIQSNRVDIQDAAGAENIAIFQSDGSVDLFHNNVKKFETTTSGATVTGTLVSDGVTSELDLSAISSSISDTAVDVFVYDTRKDSDGGAWRKRTQHTSWYNETLNTSTRGSRKAFPAVAVIVTETSQVTIYDGDDPDLPMWMVFNSGSGNALWYNNGATATVMLNGKLANASGNNQRFRTIDFLSDSHLEYSHTDGRTTFGINISQRNAGAGSFNYGNVPGSGLINRYCNDVAMTVLPNAPVDSATGLPVPTIAVATDGGVSVIKDDGSVVDIRRTSDDDVHHVALDGDRVIMFMELGAIYVATIPSADQSGNPNSAWTVYGSYGGNTSGTDHPAIQAYGAGVDLVSMKDHTFATAGYNLSDNRYKGLSILSENLESSGNGMVAWAHTDFNTGYMHGDIKGAFLSDTDTTNATVGSAHYTETFTGSGDNTWGVAGSATISGGVLTLANAADSRATDLTAASSLTTGQKYIAEIEIVSNTSQIFQLDDDGAGAGQGSVTSYGSCTSGQTGTFLIAFTKTGSPRMRFLRLSGGPATITSFKIYTAEEQDRSVNNNGLKVFGTVTKSAVATGADLVAYSGNGTSNYLEQPYNSDLDFGANSEFSVMGWMYNTNVGGGQYIFDRSVTYNSSRDWQLWVAADLKYINMYIAGGQAVTSGNNAFPNNAWFQFVVVRTGGRAKIYINGVEKASTASTLSTIPASNVPMKVLYNCNSNTKLALLRISGSVPSAEQIKKMYEDEKVLFQENTKATLYGSSDAVTALAYDDSTNVLHVGTSAGRSEFQGLRRINNTTEAVTTAISASNGLVAEQ